MYLVKRNGKKTKHTFETYEQARQYIRKQLRKLETYRVAGQPDCYMDDYGFTIVAQ